MEVHLTDSSFGNYVKSPSYPNVALFQSIDQEIPPTRRATLGIHKCVMKNDLEGLKRILSSRKRESLNDYDHFGRNAFHVALQMANPKALYLLLYYPLLHPSKLFATSEWDDLLWEYTESSSNSCEAAVLIDDDFSNTTTPVRERPNDTNVAPNASNKHDSVERDAEASGVDNFLAGFLDKAQKKKKSDADGSGRTSASISSTKIGTNLLRHWEENPNSYMKAVLGVDVGNIILGCGMKEVEALYDEHYKFLIGEPNILYQTAKVYSTRYPRLFVGHPANIAVVNEQTQNEHEDVHDQIGLGKKYTSNVKQTSTSTKISGKGNGAVDTNLGDTQGDGNAKKVTNRSIITQEEGESEYLDKGCHDTSKNNDSGQQLTGRNPFGGFNVANLLHTHSAGDDGPYIPLVTTDVIATFDKTSAVHLLFSNIYIESRRDDICKCLRILLHYFNKFPEVSEGLETKDDAAFRYNRACNEEKQSFLVPGLYSNTPTSLGLAPSNNYTIKERCTADYKVLQRFSLISLGIPSKHKTPIKRVRLSSFSGGMQNSLNNPLLKKASKLPKIGMKLDQEVGGMFHKKLFDKKTLLENLPGISGTLQNATVSPNASFVKKQSSNETECTEEYCEKLQTYPNGEIIKKPLKDTSEHNFTNSIPGATAIGSKVDIDKAIESIDLPPMPLHVMNHTLCADVNNMDVDVLKRITSAIGGMQSGKQHKTHKSCFQIPISRPKASAISRTLRFEKQDPKTTVLNAALMSSIGWIRPTQEWDVFLNKRDYTRSNILHKICQIKDVKLLKWLLVCGSMPLAVNEVGDMPVHLAMDAKDPICLITILHATMKCLFYHKLECCGSFDVTNNKKGTHNSEYRQNVSGKESAFSKYMKMLKGSINQNGKTSTVDKSHTTIKLRQRGVKEALLPLHMVRDVGHDLCNAQPLKFSESEVELNDGACKDLFNEILLLIEQLTYRGIKAEAWEALVAMFTYNEVITKHLLSNPHYMHRFVNWSILLGNAEKFIAVANYVVKTLFHGVNDGSPSELASPTHSATVMSPPSCDAIHVSVGEVGSYEDNETTTHTSDNDTPNRNSTQLKSESFRSFGFPSAPLKHVLQSDANNAKVDAVTGNQLCKTSEANLQAVLYNFRESVPNYTSKVEEKLTWIITHPTCLHHLALPEPTDAPQRRHRLIMTYPENPTRLEVIISNENGILRSDALENVKLLHSPPPATLSDILRVHDWGYINRLLIQVQLAQKRWETNAYWPVLADGDTPTTPHSWNSALYAAGAVIAAVDAVCNNTCRNAFCAVRPPGHHLGTWGGAQSPTFEDEDFAVGSQGFCLINNVAIGAAYAKYMYANKGIRRIAIVDFDIHHGNGTDQIVQNIGPRPVRCVHGATASPENPSTQPGHNLWFGWRDVNDREEVFFSSIHAYDGIFYPGTGKPCTRYAPTEPRIINVAVPDGTTSPEFRVMFEARILPYLLHFKPDLIFISAGFDGHYRDSVSSGFTKYTEKDFHWATERITAVANAVCSGRLVSVLEGGYNTRLDTLSPFARSVFEHVKALSTTTHSSLYPFIHCENTIDFLLSPVVAIDPRSTMPYGESVLRAPVNRATRMKEAIDQLLKKVYNLGAERICIIPRSSLPIPTFVANLEAIAQTDNCFYSFYSKNFWSFFMDWSSVGLIEKARRKRQKVHAEDHKVICFENLMGVEPISSAMSGSLVSYVGNVITPSKLIAGCVLEAASETEQEVITRGIMYANPWSIDIKMRSLERHATAAALMLEYFKKNEMYFTTTCRIHGIVGS